MNKYLVLAFFMLFALNINAQKKSDSHIIGHVVCCDEHIAFANIMVKNTTIGTATDETGHYQLLNIPAGTYTIIAQSLGYKPQEKTITVSSGKTIELNFDLEADALGLEEVVVTGDRNKKNRKESAVVVNTLTPKALETNNSATISDGLNFCSGLRMENNCQNCGFNQLRMNGLEGPYSQILINSRAIFSGLAGVYGLELIPTNMIERVEIVRGGGSALYGSNAIGGTVNLILKDPITNSYEFSSTGNMYGLGYDNPSYGVDISLNSSIVSSDSKTGMSVYGFHRDKQFFDANNDGFSELAQAKNTTIGTRIFHRFNQKTKLSFDYFSINEKRRGGSNFDVPYHMSQIAEAVEHNINTAAINMDIFVREMDQIAIYASAQHILRDSYYGANYSLADYGKTKDISYSTGIQYTMREEKSNLVAGIESTGSYLNDIKLAYPDINNPIIQGDSISQIPITNNTTIANQQLIMTGVYAQYEYKFSRFRLSLGARLDNYTVNDLADANQKKSGNVFSPRANTLFDITENIQFRASYSQGFRAPQIFDEDLHIETSGSRKVIHRNDANLVQETSHSISSSLDFRKKIAKVNTTLLIEGFYTLLQNPFVNEYGSPDENGTVIYTRINAESGATVQGINLELGIYPSKNINIKAGFTIQKSFYEEVQEFNERSFLRTPENYGFLTADYKLGKKSGISLTGTYTGTMLVPYFGNTISNPEEGELRTSDPFLDMGFKVRHNIKLNGASLQIFAGVKNILNSYQKDFDIGIDRDPAYIYGPTSPRTLYFGIKLGNML